MANLLEETVKTILVVDDDEMVRRLVVTILEHANFKVMSADSGAGAIQLSQGSAETIDLLLSDVEMARMSGPDLGKLLKIARPQIHVMLMSGQPSGNLPVPNYGWAFIQKPFIPRKLVEMVMDVLYSDNRSQPGGQEFDSRRDTKNPNYTPSNDPGHPDSHPPNSNEPNDRKRS